VNGGEKRHNKDGEEGDSVWLQDAIDPQRLLGPAPPWKRGGNEMGGRRDGKKNHLGVEELINQRARMRERRLSAANATIKQSQGEKSSKKKKVGEKTRRSQWVPKKRGRDLGKTKSPAHLKPDRKNLGKNLKEGESL